MFNSILCKAKRFYSEFVIWFHHKHVSMNENERRFAFESLSMCGTLKKVDIQEKISLRFFFLVVCTPLVKMLDLSRWWVGFYDFILSPESIKVMVRHSIDVGSFIILLEIAWIITRWICFTVPVAVEQQCVDANPRANQTQCLLCTVQKLLNWRWKNWCYEERNAKGIPKWKLNEDPRFLYEIE